MSSTTCPPPHVLTWALPTYLPLLFLPVQPVPLSLIKTEPRGHDLLSSISPADADNPERNVKVGFMCIYQEARNTTCFSGFRINC